MVAKKIKTSSKSIQPVSSPRIREETAQRRSVPAAERHRLAGAKRVAAATKGRPRKILRISITNVYDGNDYSAQLLIGSENAPANVILDTGSSTLAVDPKVYNGISDKDLKTTTEAQLVVYGTGGWAGPVINTSLSFGKSGTNVILESAPIAITSVQQRGNFQGVGGIMGLAYNGLNTAFDFKNYFSTNHKPSTTFPWPFAGKSFKIFSNSFRNLVKTNNVPEVDVTPYFDQLENNGVVANKFAFYTQRSWVSTRSGSNQASQLSDRLNRGIFVLGGGEEQTDLLVKGSRFSTVNVLDDLYYNTNLKSVEVEGCGPVVAAPLQSQHKDFMVSNSIVDSGTSDLSLAGDVYKAILAGLNRLSPAFSQSIEKAIAAGKKGQGIPVGEVALGKWPNIYFVLSGKNGEDIRLACSPHTYWQVDFPVPGQAMFQISGAFNGPNQSIFGLPLMNNYYTVFDRSEDSQGVIRFAPINPDARV